MPFSLSFGHYHEQRHTVRKTHRLDHSHRHEQRIGMRRRINEALGRVTYAPEGECPSCGHVLSLAEILRGFLDSVTDTTSECPSCKTRFQPHLVSRQGVSTRAEVSFYCRAQALDGLRGLDGLKPREIERANASLYQSALLHFGTVQAAFRELGVVYRFGDQVDGWEQKVRPFLGNASDGLIAECVGVPTTRIARLRRSLGIASLRSSLTA